MMCLIYHVISSSITSAGTWMIICTWNSQITSSLSQIWVSCSTLLMTSFPLEKNIQWLNRDQRHPPWLPGFSFAQISPLLWSFFSILVEFHWDRGIEWREILNQYTSGTAIIISNNKIFLAFYNNFDTTCRMVIYMYILPRNKILLFPIWLQRPTRSILSIPWSWTWERSILETIQIHTKLSKIAAMIIFFTVVIKRRRIQSQ